MKPKTAMAGDRPHLRTVRKTEFKQSGGNAGGRAAMRPDAGDLTGDAQFVEEALLLRSPKQENL